MPTLKYYFFYLFFTCFAFQQGIAQNLDTLPKVVGDSIPLPSFNESTTIFQKISQDSFIDVVLETNFDSLLKNKKVSIEKYSGTILFKNKKESIKIKVKVTPRGRSRRKVCEMPPLKIDFPKKALNRLGLFPGCDKLKLVTHCNDTEGSDQVLMKEYWTYKIYNQLTPNSFQVFPVRITYVNSNDPTEKMERFAFFIESNEGLAYRLQGTYDNGFGTTADKLEKESYHNTLMFQYMIGNADWDIIVQRNVKLIQTEKDSLLIVVPYDFDYSALVGAPYARLNPDLKQTNIEQRFCQGQFLSKELLLKRVEAFVNLNIEHGFHCYKTCPVLHKKQKKKMNRYLNSFYKVLEDEEDLLEIFLDN